MANIVTQIIVTDDQTSAADVSKHYLGSDAYQTVQKIVSHLMSLAFKTPRRGKYSIQTLNGDGVVASGSVTCATVSAADTVTVGNIVFTAVTGTPTAGQFKCGVSNTADGLSLANAINANVTLAQLVNASNLSGAVTISALQVGVAGNCIQLSSSNNTRLAVVAMASGANDSSVASSFSCGI